MRPRRRSLLMLLESVEADVDSGPAQYVESEEFQKDAKELDSTLKPILKHINDKQSLRSFVQHLEGILDLPNAGEGFSRDASMVKAYVGHGGFGDMHIAEEEWDDPVYGLYRIHMLIKKGHHNSGHRNFGAYINFVRGAVRAFLDDVEKLSKIKPEVNPPDAKNPIFGKFVFAPARRMKVPPEEDTPEERDAYVELSRHVQDNVPLSGDVALNLMQILDDDTYPSILREPGEEYLYRGISIDKYTFQDMLGEELPKISEPVGHKDMTVRVSPRGKHGESSSWTTDWKTAADFSRAQNPGMLSVVFVARRSDNPDTFLSGPDGFYKVSGLGKYQDEKESIALGSVKVFRVYWTDRGMMDVRQPASFEGTKGVKENKMDTKLLRKLVREVMLSEVDIEDVGDVCYTAGSTHVMKTCKIGGNKYFLKFSDEDLFEGVDPSLQILVEYLAYRIYGLYSGIKIPTPELVYDAPKKRVGLATTPVGGKMALKVGTDPKYLAKMMSQGVYVDVFLANWDVIGTGSGNVFVDSGEATRIDPGGSLTFRAQGGRKGKAFGPKVGELETMLKSGSGAGAVFMHADLKSAAQEFLAVSWDAIQSELDNVCNEVSEQLETRGMKSLFKQWTADCDSIKSTLAKRHKEVADHAKFAMKR